MWIAAALAMAVAAAEASPAPPPPPRARDLGIPFDHGTPGRWNAITDVAGVEVGHVTIVEGEAVRTGVTAVLPRGKTEAALRPCFAGWFALNGNGEMTGTTWIEESGLLEGPVMITNTSSVGVVRDATIAYAARRWPGAGEPWALPVVGETWDGHLSDIAGMHVRAAHAWQALDDAVPGPVPEGAVGGGTGMVAFEYKGGIGTASRVLPGADGGYTVGVLVQANFGLREHLRVGGLPVGLEMREDLVHSKDQGSLIVVVATDAPILPHQARRLARRASLGMARTGGIASNSSGDIFVALTTAPVPTGGAGPHQVGMLANDALSPLFAATVAATEEAILNALVAARTMTGRGGHTVQAMPQGRLREILRRHGRLKD